MRIIPLVFLGLTLSQIGFAQGEVSIIDPTINPGQIIDQFDLRVATREGSSFISDDWNIGKIQLSDRRLLDGLKLKYDLENQDLKVQVDGEVRVLDLHKIQTFQWVTIEGNTEYFINCREFAYDDGVPLIGVFQILADGPLKLFLKTEAKLKRPDYNAALDVGNMNEKIVKVESPFLADEITVYEYPKTKTDFISYFGDKSQQMDSFVKSEKLKYKNMDDAQRILSYYGSLSR